MNCGKRGRRLSYPGIWLGALATTILLANGVSAWHTHTPYGDREWLWLWGHVALWAGAAVCSLSGRRRLMEIARVGSIAGVVMCLLAAVCGVLLGLAMRSADIFVLVIDGPLYAVQWAVFLWLARECIACSGE